MSGNTELYNHSLVCMKPNIFILAHVELILLVGYIPLRSGVSILNHKIPTVLSIFIYTGADGGDHCQIEEAQVRATEREGASDTDDGTGRPGVEGYQV